MSLVSPLLTLLPSLKMGRELKEDRFSRGRPGENWVGVSVRERAGLECGLTYHQTGTLVDATPIYN